MKDMDQIIHQLYQTTRIISTGLNQRLEVSGIYSSEWTILSTIQEKGVMSQTMLAGYLNIEPAAISKTLAKLEQKNFVERKTGTDKREKMVFLTEAAKTCYSRWQNIVAHHRQHLLTGITEEQLTVLYDVLQQISANAQHVK